MRPVKFRAWDVFYNKMVFSNETLAGLESFWRMVRHGEEAGREVPVMQFTGLKDKSECDIYENDIVKAWTGTREINCKIKWDDHLAQYVPFFQKKHWEVIGNIHENLDLLKVV